MQGIIKHDQELMKKSNKKTILSLIRERNPISRAQLAKITRMSPTSVSRIVTELMELGLVKETDLTTSGVGRKASLLATDPSSTHIIALHMDSDYSTIGIVDFDGRIIGKKEFKFSSKDSSWQDIIDQLCKIVGTRIDKEENQDINIIGIGVALPGIIDGQKGRVVFSPQLGWSNLDLQDYLEKELGYKIIIDNSIKAKALAENIYGSAKESEKAVYLNFGSGVGSALIINDEIFRGVTNSAGEIGHTTIDPDGKLCDCGRRGCLQTYITDWALIQEAKTVKDIESVKEIFDSFSTGEEWAVNILDRLYRYIGIAVSNTICMYNPDTVIIGGTLIEEEKDIKEIFIEKVEEQIWEPFKGTYRIKLSELGEEASLLGMAELILNKYIDSEI